MPPLRDLAAALKGNGLAWFRTLLEAFAAYGPVPSPGNIWSPDLPGYVRHSASRSIRKKESEMTMVL
jgi:hypothetical protein